MKKIKPLLKRQTALNLCGNIALSLITLLIIEVTLRISGHTPWTRLDLDKNEFLFARDDYLGWRALPDNYNLVPIDKPITKSITFTIFSDGGRKTRIDSQNGAVANEYIPTGSTVAEFVGGSFIQGHGLSDNETIPWKVQKLLPLLDIRNYGVGAYGTIQTLLNMKLLLKKRILNKRHIIYAFCEFHELRNVLDPSNLSAISKYSPSGNIKVPYASLDSSGNLQMHKPEGYPMFYGRETFSLVKLLEDFYMYASSWHRRKDARRVTELLLLEMQKETKEANADFSVLMLDLSDTARASYLKFMKEHNINVIDCVDRRYDNKDMRQEHDPHPNEKMTELWSKCIASKLNKELPLT